MERITKVYFDPLATTKPQIRILLESLPVGSAHPFSPERLLLCRTATGIDEIDISSYDDSHFFNAVDLGALGQTLQTRMTKFASQLRLFNDEYTVQQAPMSSVFKVPIEDKIAILAVSERYPTYYDLCVADSDCETCCYGATFTFPGIKHSGDINHGSDLLHHINIDKERLQEGKEFAIFVSGFSQTKLTRFQERNPVVMIANHTEKALYIVPVPLDAASIGDATLCSPVVFKREGDSLVCSILPTPTTDLDKSCTSSSLESASFKDAIQRADWTISTVPAVLATNPIPDTTPNIPSPPKRPRISAQKHAVFVTETTVLSRTDSDTTQLIRYGKGLEFVPNYVLPEANPSAVVLPCIFGSPLEGPLLLATGKCPENVPFDDQESLRTFYQRFESVLVYVDERMTDNARNLATHWRMNAIFIIQMAPDTKGDVKPLLDLININAVTALAGPQSLVLVQIASKYYFYRGIGNRLHLNTSKLDFGSDVTSIVESAGLEYLLDPRAVRMINLSESNTVLLPNLGQVTQPKDLQNLFENLKLDQIENLEDDISAIVPQLQVLLGQKDLVELSQTLSSVLSKKVGDAIEPQRTAYIEFVRKEYKLDDPESVKKKNLMLNELRKVSIGLQKSLESVISHLSNMMSSQTTSKRTHDLKRLERQAAIKNNVEAVKSMTFESLAGLLETKAEEMGVMLLNIETTPYKELLGNLKRDYLDANPCCDLDARVLFLEGFDAGIIIEQSQSKHNGPLKHQLGITHPILALPYLSQERGSGSMLAWVCWDEFVKLDSPFKVRWMEKCNDTHVAALRIIMRDTLAQAVASREHNLQPGAPEVGQLMSALLMAAMSKLAAMRTTAPVRMKTAEDTVTKLMRGLFGNLLTTAGSGVRPMSMVWQLFGLDPKLDVPATAVAWSWYENVVRLYPYTGWPQRLFNQNLEKLLDKALIAVITKNENTESIKASRMDAMIKYCQLRNIQLEHSRTFVTIFVRMLKSDADRKAIATRLLAALPAKLAKQSSSYGKMIGYLKYVASSGVRREADDIVIVGVYLKRSAAFKDIKQSIAKACRADNTEDIEKGCFALMEKFKEIADEWALPQDKLVMQNAKAYKGLQDTDATYENDEAAKKARKDFVNQVLSDAEKVRVPWQVGKEGEFGADIEPLDEDLMHEIMTGEKSDVSMLTDTMSEIKVAAKPQGMKQFSALVKPEFISAMEKVVNAQDVCKIMNVPISAMRVFVTALNPGFDMENELGKNFIGVVVSLLADRKDRQKQQPIRALFGMEIKEDKVEIEEKKENKPLELESGVGESESGGDTVMG